MKRKRLDRDVWWTHNRVIVPPYYQMRVDIEGFYGLVGLLRLVDGPFEYWDMPIAGRTPIIGKGMTWLQLLPEGRKHVVTAMYKPDHSVSIWYVDVIENVEYDPDGVAVFFDKYLDVIFTPQGDLKIDDRDELDEALRTADITRPQYEAALRECDAILLEHCADVKRTEALCDRILDHVNARVRAGEKPLTGTV